MKERNRRIEGIGMHNPSVSIKNATAGITLIALVITIIVLLILAGVSIAALTGGNGILTQVGKARTNTEIAEAKERAIVDIATWISDKISKREDSTLNDAKIKEILTGKEYVKESKETSFISSKGHEIDYSDLYKNSNGGGQTGELQPGDIATETKKDNYTDETGKKATIPEGFKVSDKENEKNIDTGLVVINPVDGSEFVWIPVETAVSDTEANGTTNKAMAINLGTQEAPQYRGLLYDYTSSGSTVKSGCTTTTDSYREPDIVSDDNNTTYLGIINTVLETSFATQDDFKIHLQEEYNNMVESVKKYGGFYVGRYETSLNGNTVRSKKNETSATAESSSGNMWYGLYSKQKTYHTNSVQGQMMWGSQWDSMLNWMQKNNIDVTSETPTDKVVGTTAKNTTRVTGSVETDRINNIYDILGNSLEWPSEANGTFYRVLRSGYYHDSNAPSYRDNHFPSNTLSYNGSRVALYIK